MRSTSATEALLHALDEAYGRKAWHGQNLNGSLRGVGARMASWRPAPGRHDIREIVVHAAYWKWLVRRRLGDEDGDRRRFPFPGRDWFELPPVTEAAWRGERELLAAEHAALRRAVAAFPARRLGRVLPGTKNRTALREIAGVALHDVYHTGQIQLLKALGGRKRG